MKTLLITGSYLCESSNLPVLYDITLFGQTDDSPEIVLITSFKLSLFGYDELVRVCKDKFCKYYNVSDNNIIALFSCVNVKSYFKYAE